VPAGPRKHPCVGETSAKVVHRTLLEVQKASLAWLQQQRRNELESEPQILKRLTELERLVRGRPRADKAAEAYPRPTFGSVIFLEGNGQMATMSRTAIATSPEAGVGFVSGIEVPGAGWRVQLHTVTRWCASCVTSAPMSG
jgi:hypothetical protein